MITFLPHYLSIATTIALPALGVGIGQGLATWAALQAINEQPSAKSDVSNLVILGMALVETAAIMGFVVAFMLLFGSTTVSVYGAYGELGIACAVGLPGFFIGICSSLPIYQSCFALAQQPFFASKIVRFMLITQSLIETPLIFGFIIALFIKNQTEHATTLLESYKCIASGLCIGLGCIGPSLGMAHFARTACRSIGINRNAYNQIFTFTFISEAIIETPIIFSLVIAILILISSAANTTLAGIAMLAASLCIGIGTLGPGISSGRTASSACINIAKNPENYGILSRTSMFGQGIIDTSAIYALLIAMMLILIAV